MATLTARLVKGIHETSGLYRDYYWWGAELGCPDYFALDPEFGDPFISIPTPLGEASIFDFSTISPDHESVGVYVTLTGASGGKVNFRYQWYKKVGENWEMFIDFSRKPLEGDWAWCWHWNAIGWTPRDIHQDGDYKVVVTPLYDYSYLSPITIEFTVTGISGENFPGFIWIEGENIHFIDGNGNEAVAVAGGKLVTDAGDPGYIYTSGDYLYYIDENRDLRYIGGAVRGTGATPGYLWIDGLFLYYTSESGYIIEPFPL